MPLLVIGFLIRRGVEESPVYRAAQEKAESAEDKAARKESSSIIEALRKPRPLLHGLGMRLGENIAFYVYTIFVIAYATTYFDYTRARSSPLSPSHRSASSSE